MTQALSFQQKSLQQQGYANYNAAQLNELNWGLRFTPGLCMAGAIYGLITQNANLHLFLAVLGIAPFWFPAWHPLDRIYNHLLRPLWGGVMLPPNPLPRRIACFMGGAMNIGIALSFKAGNVPLAYGFGGTLVLLQLIVNTTHFCLASWMWEQALGLVGIKQETFSADKARQLIKQGAMLIDVREPSEFASGHLPNAVNIPLGQIASRTNDFKGKTAVFYCKSGMRSRNAVKTLEKAGCDNLYNLGAMANWEK